MLDAGGEVLKFIGDAVLAIFPVDPQAKEGATDNTAEACANALQAAREALVRLEQLNDRRRQRDEAPLRFGVALHLGEVTYGNVGVAGRLDFTVIGPAINETARLEALSKTLKRDVLLSDAFARHVTEPLEPLGKHCLRGVSAQHEIFTPGPAPDRT